jgi:hypothetical protein
MSEDSVRFRAECQTCPYRTNPEWGHREATSAFEHSDESAVTRWATQHVKANSYQHHVVISRVIRFPINVEYLDKTVLDILTGRVHNDG